MNKYQNGKIYKLVDENDLWYIGSTIYSLNERLNHHLKNYFCMSRYLINPKIYLLEDYPCNNRNELRIREQFYLNKYREKCINDRKAYQSLEERKVYNKKLKKEYIKKHKEEIKEYDKNYRKKNKEKIYKKAKEKVECECGDLVCKRNIARHRKTKSHQKKMIENNINGKNISAVPSS